ncbi:MAG: VWA domain-containing protein [Planctomycetes bacterium]|nr:VWA domain-containing protein [Planctomycetota bacterium]
MTTLTLLDEAEWRGCCPVADEPGVGALSTPRGNLPLRLLDVHARVTGLFAETTVRQTFVNTLGVPLEATYIFPLPDRAAATRFRLEVGERVVEGELQERGKARATYDQALRTGHRAAIAEEERPGVFTMRVGNLMPGDEATVWLTLTGPVPFADGEATFQFPLVVAPRYIPGAALGGEQAGDGVAQDTDAVPDASRISPPVLLPGFPNPVRLSITVDLDPAGQALGRVRSSLHAVSTDPTGEGRVQVRLVPGERLDRDFVLRYALVADDLRPSLVLAPDEGDAATGTFCLTIVPPAEAARERRPKDVVLLLDRSGSMEGWKMVAARRATARLVDSLGPQDRFAVYAFDDQLGAPATLGADLVLAQDRNRYRAVEWLAKLEARGGTELAHPLRKAARTLLSATSVGEVRDRVVVLVTDGQVGNEDQILRTLGDDLGRLRVFTLGIDQAVNAAFLRRLAALGGGACELVESEDRLDEVMDKVHARIDAPVLSDLRLEAAGGLELLADSVVPARLPDLFAGAPVTVLGRCRGRAGTLTVRGVDQAGLRFEQTLAAVPAARAGALAAAWARGQVRQLEDRYLVAPGHERAALERRLVEVSLRWSVLCRFTAFVAVDRAEVVNEGGGVHRVTQAVEQPAGWGEQADGRARHANKHFAPPRRPAPRPAFDDDEGAFGGGASFSVVSFSGAPSAPAAGRAFAPPGGAAFGPAQSADPFAADGDSLELEGETFECAMPPFGADVARGEAAMDPFAAPPGDPFAAPPGDPFAGDPFGDPGAPPAPRARLGAPIPLRSMRQADSAPPAEGADLPLDGYRRRAEDLVTLLAGRISSSIERQRELGRLVVLLRRLLEDLRSVGAPAHLVRPLDDLARELEVIQRHAAGQLDDRELERLWERAGEVLRAYVRGGGGASPPPPPATGGGRRAFWK